MDIIIKIADDFSKRHFRTIPKPYAVIDLVNIESLRIDNPLDRIKFLNFLIESNRSNNEKHEAECRNKENCQTLKNHEIIAYFLTQELEKLGLHKETDTFTNKDKTDLNQTLDNILIDLQTLKDGQEIIYEDLSKEIAEIKDLYFLGKKQWKQIWFGKIVDMTLSGIISKTISEKLLSEFKEAVLFLSNK